MISINNLSFSYNKLEPYLLDNINLNIEKGEYISILGENGSGKSTFLKLLLKLLTPSTGSITISSKKIGYVPQKNDSFNSEFPITVQEILDIHRKLLKIKDKSIIKESLTTMNMEAYKNSLIGNLSGGQRQKIFIARALIGNPDLIILDEPSTGVDLKSQEEIYEIIKHLNKRHKITVLSVEHNLKAALKYSSSIFYMEQGKGTLYNPEDYLNNIAGGTNYATI